MTRVLYLSLVVSRVAGETIHADLRVGRPMALAVGMANSEVKFVFPTSKEVGHPSVDLCRSTSAFRQAEPGARTLRAAR